MFNPETYDPIEDQLRALKSSLRAGADSFTIGPTVLADLLDQADSREDIVEHRLAFGVVGVLEFLKTAEAQTAFLAETLGAVRRGDEHYELDTGEYVAIFRKQGDRWTWGTLDQPQWHSDAMDALEENDRVRRSNPS